jgi:hypothetical protein
MSSLLNRSLIIDLYEVGTYYVENTIYSSLPIKSDGFEHYSQIRYLETRSDRSVDIPIYPT